MPSLPLTTLIGVWGVTALSRLPPGALTLAAVRTADERGVRAAAAVLAGALVAELAVTAVLIAGVARLPVEVFQDEGTRRAAMSLALAAAGACCCGRLRASALAHVRADLESWRRLVSALP